MDQLGFYDEIIVDNFAGGGGASTGIELAIGRSVDIAINHDPAAIAMHKANHPFSEHFCESVWDVDPVKAVRGRKVALCWFSPDCKHFSKAKGSTPVKKEIRGLAWVALRWASRVRPRVIMLENVEEFKTWGPLMAKRDKATGRVLKKTIIEDSSTLTDDEYDQIEWETIAEKGEVVPYKQQIFEPDKSKAGRTFLQFIKALNSLGYEVETKELLACAFGAPTKRKRFFLIARCDGQPIVWPSPTHGDRKSQGVEEGLLKPYVSAAEIIDWSVPCKSIFGRKKPLAENTLKRIARGLQKFVVDNPEPFIVQVNHGGEGFRGQQIHEPMPTITAKHGFGVVTPYIMQTGHTGFTEERNKSVEEPITTIVSKAEHCLIAPTLIQYHSETTENSVRGQSMKEPIMTLDSSPRYGLVSAFISKNYAGQSRSVASGIDDCIHTITARQCHSMVEVKMENGAQPNDEVMEFFEKYYGKTVFGDKKKTENESPEALISSHIIQMNKNSIGTDVRDPLNTIVAGPGHMGEVKAFLIKYYGQGIGQRIEEPLDTVVSKDRFGLVTIQGVDYQIVDIGLRMLEPRELFNAQGFPADYIIDKDFNGKPYPKTAQVARCGNAVPPPFAKALVKSNLPELCTETKVEWVS